MGKHKFLGFEFEFKDFGRIGVNLTIEITWKETADTQRQYNKARS